MLATAKSEGLSCVKHTQPSIPRCTSYNSRVPHLSPDVAVHRCSYHVMDLAVGLAVTIQLLMQKSAKETLLIKPS